MASSFDIDEAFRRIARLDAIKAANAASRNPGNDLVRRWREENRSS